MNEWMNEWKLYLSFYVFSYKLMGYIVKWYVKYQIQITKKIEKIACRSYNYLQNLLKSLKTSKYLQELKGQIFLMFLLNEFRVSTILKCLGNFDQMRGPIYFVAFLPNRTVSNLGSSKSLFLKLYWVFFKLNKSEIFTGTRLCLTLNINVAMSCRRLLYNLGSLARSSSSW